MEHSLEKAHMLDSEHMAVLNDAFRSTSQDAEQEVQPNRLRMACLLFAHTR